VVGAAALEDVGDLQEEMLVGTGTDQLEADGKAGGSETTGDGDGWNPGEIGGPIWPEEQGPSWMIVAVELDGFLTDERGGDGCGWNREGIDACIFQGGVELLDEF
jgi:hypothetical protein